MNVALPPPSDLLKRFEEARALKRYDVVMLGNFAKDLIVIGNERRVAKGGGVYYGSVVLRRMGRSVAVITRLAKRDFPLLDELKNLGIDVYAVEAEQTSGIENIYVTPDLDRRVTKLLGFAGGYRCEDIPEGISWRAFMVVPIIGGEVDLGLLECIRRRTSEVLALDVQGFVRVPEDGNLVFKDWEEKERGLKMVDILKMDDAEAEVLTGEKDVRRAAGLVADYGVKEVLLTHSKGVLVYADGEIYEEPWTSKTMRGRTGRGDTCFAAYVGARLEVGPKEALAFAAEVTSRKMEHPGPYYGPLPELPQ